MKISYTQLGNLNRSLDVIWEVMFDMKTNLTLVKIRKAVNAHLSEYQSVFEKIEREYFDFSVADFKWNHPIKDPSLVWEVSKKKEELNETKVELKVPKIELTIPKWNKTLTTNVLIWFIDVFGEKSIK